MRKHKDFTNLQLNRKDYYLTLNEMLQVEIPRNILFEDNIHIQTILLYKNEK